MRKKDKDIAREMLVAGNTPEDVAQQTAIPLQTVNKIDEWLHRGMSVLWFQKSHPEALAKYHPQYAQRPIVESAPESGEASEPETEAPSAPTVNAAPVAPPLSVSPQPIAPMYNMPNGAATSTFATPPAQEPSYYSPPQRPQMPIPNQNQGQRMMVPVRENEENGTMQMLAAPRPVDIGSEPAAGKGRGNVNVTPMTLVWYDYMKGTGYDRDLPSFLEEVTVGYFAKSGRKFVMVVDNGFG